jgi:hypothetical protein
VLGDGSPSRKNHFPYLLFLQPPLMISPYSIVFTDLSDSPLNSPKNP